MESHYKQLHFQYKEGAYKIIKAKGTFLLTRFCLLSSDKTTQMSSDRWTNSLQLIPGDHTSDRASLTIILYVRWTKYKAYDSIHTPGAYREGEEIYGPGVYTGITNRIALKKTSGIKGSIPPHI